MRNSSFLTNPRVLISNMTTVFKNVALKHSHKVFFIPKSGFLFFHEFFSFSKFYVPDFSNDLKYDEISYLIKFQWKILYFWTKNYILTNLMVLITNSKLKPQITQDIFCTKFEKFSSYTKFWIFANSRVPISKVVLIISSFSLKIPK